MNKKLPFKPRLDKIDFGIKYECGHLYFDRCGQTIVDIQNIFPNFLFTEANAQGSTMTSVGENITISFSYDRFIFSIEALKEDTIINAINYCQTIWKIVQGNLNLDLFNRIGCRMFYIVPADSREDAEKLIGRSGLNISYPDSLISKNYEPKVRHIVSILQKGDIEYRLELKGIARILGRPPSHLEITDPKALSRNQRNAQIELLKARTQYSREPMYAVQFDIDSYCYEPENIQLENFIKQQISITKSDFLPILEGVC